MTPVIALVRGGGSSAIVIPRAAALLRFSTHFTDHPITITCTTGSALPWAYCRRRLSFLDGFDALLVKEHDFHGHSVPEYGWLYANALASIEPY